jgi:hypothetical protein
MFQCGQDFILAHGQDLVASERESAPHLSDFGSTPMSRTRLCSAYLGPVDVRVREAGIDSYLLSGPVILKNGFVVECTVIDCDENNLKPLQNRYTAGQLRACKPVVIDLSANRVSYLTLLSCEFRLAQHRSNVEDEAFYLKMLLDVDITRPEERALRGTHPELSFLAVRTEPEWKLIRRLQAISSAALVQLAPVDALLHMQNTQLFMSELAGVHGLLGKPQHFSLTNVKHLDSAIFTGDYMLTSGDPSSYYPILTSDGAGHEYGHAFVAHMAGLHYQGHGAALSEGFADIIGCCYENFLMCSTTCRDLVNRDDNAWLTGEDLGVSMPHLRNFENPHRARQPAKFKEAPFYINPASRHDAGGGHANSGIILRIFFYCVQIRNVPLGEAFRLFMKVLRDLNPDADLLDFRDALLARGSVAGHWDICMEALQKADLGLMAVSDQPGKLGACDSPAAPNPKAKRQRLDQPAAPKTKRQRVCHSLLSCCRTSEEPK